MTPISLAFGWKDGIRSHTAKGCERDGQCVEIIIQLFDDNKYSNYLMIASGNYNSIL
jgi:hypothetical protein